MKRYLGFLDILGFREMVTSMPNDKLQRIFENFRIYVQRSLAEGKTTLQNGKMVSDLSASTINSALMSDSLVFWTNTDSTMEFFQLVNLIQDFMMFCHNKPKIFLRGAITIGDFFYDNSGLIKGKNSLNSHTLLFGKALVEAFILEKTIDIAGCIITEDAIKRASEEENLAFKENFDNCLKERKIVEYETPTKKGVTKYYNINWVQDTTYPTRDEIKEGFTSHNKKLDNEGAVKKMENTLAFYDFIKK